MKILALESAMTARRRNPVGVPGALIGFAVGVAALVGLFLFSRKAEAKGGGDGGAPDTGPSRENKLLQKDDAVLVFGDATAALMEPALRTLFAVEGHPVTFKSIPGNPQAAVAAGRGGDMFAEGELYDIAIVSFGWADAMDPAFVADVLNLVRSRTLGAVVWVDPTAPTPDGDSARAAIASGMDEVWARAPAWPVIFAYQANPVELDGNDNPTAAGAARLANGVWKRLQEGA